MILNSRSNSPLFDYKVKQFADFIKAEPDEINEIKHYLYYKDVENGQLIYQQGEAADKLYFLVHGYIVLETSDSRGNEMDIFSHREQIFPISALFRDGEYRQTARALYNTQVLYFQKEALEFLAKKYTHILISLYKEMGKVMESEDSRMTLYAGKSIEEKLVSLLLYLGQEIGKDEGDFYKIRNIVNNTQLSRMICVSRESTSHTINKLKRHQLVFQNKDYMLISKALELY